MTAYRRHLPYSVWPLFGAVIVVACWLGWQAKIVWNRKAAIVEAGGSLAYEHDAPGSELGFVRAWMGDFRVREFQAKEGEIPPEDIERIRAAFPEAKIVFWTDEIAAEDRIKWDDSPTTRLDGAE